MSEFICRLGSAGGRVVEKTYQAESEQALRRELEEKEFHVFSIRRRRPLSLSLRSLSLLSLLRREGRGHKVRVSDFLVFNQEFMALVKAGMPILHSLTLLSERIKDPTFKRILLSIRDGVESGASLSEAFEAQGAFSRVYTASLMAGERSGELVAVLRRYVDYLKIVMNMRRKVFSAMIYPIILVLLSIGLITIMILYVIPNFQKFYEDFGAELPAITQMLLSFAFFMRNNVIFVIAGLILGVAALRAYDRTPAGGVQLDRLKMRIPLLGTIWQQYSISQMARTLATLLGGGIPLVASLDVSARAVGNRLISREVTNVSQQVSEGQSLAESLERTGLFTPLTVEMVKVGETSGALTEMLSNVSDFYDEEVENRVSTLISMLEPLLLIGMGLVIAGMLLAMYLPLFQAINAVRG